MRGLFRVSCLSLAFVVFLFGAVHAVFAKAGGPREYREQELLVKFRSDIPGPAKEAVHKKFGSKKIKDFPFLRIEHLKLREGLDVEQAIEEYLREPGVEYVEPNFMVHAAGTFPNDTFFGELWGMHNTGQNGGTPGADIGAADAWSLTTGSGSIVVAVLDSGTDYTHEDLAANMWVNPGEYGKRKGRDDDGNGYIDDIYGVDVFNKDGNPLDDHGHGTHVAGTIGAVGNNGLGVAGVNWNVKIMACKFLGAGGSGTVDGAIQCLEYVRDMKARGATVVATNNSWGGSDYSQALADAINAQREILFIASAGNSGADLDAAPSYPASYGLPNIIAVAATDRYDNRTWFSNYGKGSVHVGAPGLDIVSLRAKGTDMYGDGAHFIPAGDPNAKYYLASGTSMAAPHVTGIAALLKARTPSVDWIFIRNRILSGVDPLPSLEASTATGGRINAYRALTCANSPVLSILRPPRKLVAGNRETLSALSINCEMPAGPVSVTLLSGEVIPLRDDGIAPDLAAGDGIFSAYWTPVAETESLIFSSPAGSEAVSIPALAISTSLLVEGNIRAVYNEPIRAIGGLPPYTWSLASGSLPDGLTLDSTTGVISGAPTRTGIFSFSVSVRDAANTPVSKDLSIRVVDDPVVALWLRAYDLYSAGDAIAVDKNDNVIVSGLTTTGATRDRLVIKYDALGNTLWARVMTSADRGAGVAVDGSGNILVTGSKYTDVLTNKFDPQGSVLWSMTYAGPVLALETATDVAVDSLGNAYVTGYTTGGATSYDRLTIKYGPQGNELWTRTHDSGYFDYAYGVAVGPDDGIYVAGHLWTALVYDCVIAKYDTAGNLLKTSTYPNAQCLDVTTDATGNVYVTGAATNDFLIMKYDPELNLLWARTYDRSAKEVGRGIAVGPGGTIYVTGETLQPGSSSLYDALTIAFDPAGSLLWTKVYDSGASDGSKGIAVDKEGDVYVTGFMPTTSFTIKYRKQ